MHKIIRFYNQNEKVIWASILGIVLLFVLIQLLNYNAKKKIEEGMNNNIVNTKPSVQYNNVTLDSKESVLTGDNLSNEQQESIKIIDEFISYCKNEEIEKAYAMLSAECKELFYLNVQSFKENYFDKILINNNTNVIIENWADNIYKVNFKENALQTGVYTETAYQDYITVVKDSEGNKKLNVNSYIERKKINKKTEKQNMEITILEKDSYMDYETYKMRVVNNSDSSIMLGKGDNTMFLMDKKDKKYLAYTHELPESQLIVPSGGERLIEIKYDNKYSENRVIKSLVFSKVIMNYDHYSSIINPNNYNKYFYYEIGF